MTNAEKIEIATKLLLPEIVSTDILETYMQIAETIVLDRRFPFGYKEGTVVPAKYEHVQIQIALQLYAKRGAEGQISHSENGISRTWDASVVSDSLLNLITPLCESVVSANADTL